MKTAVIALIAALACPAVRSQEISKPRLTVLDNGLRVVTVEDRKSPIVAAV
jgi:predicted Zn-dependent peptidase